LRHKERLFADPEGDELADDAAARAYAVEVAGDLIRDGKLTLIRSWLDCLFEITDGTGRRVATVAFVDAAVEGPREREYTDFVN